MNYDPEARRNTPLALKLMARIRRDGPITVSEYMHACLHDPEHGYYVTQPAIGAAGDFITAPEISQTFGELIGLWCAVVWQSMGSPTTVNLAELGPGRGTLLSDALRATRAVPGFHAALNLQLYESNAALKAEQATRLRTAPRISWVDQLPDIASGPTIILANEFLDTCPVTQIEVTNERWHIRNVGLDSSGRLAFARDPEGFLPARNVYEMYPSLRPGSIVESQDFSFYIPLQDRRRDPFAGLFIDYGHYRFQPGDTLQAIRMHKGEHPLTSPGEADLTVQVCFEKFEPYADLTGLSQAMPSTKHAIDGPVTQAELLGSLGIMERASKLMAMNPAKAGEIEAGVARLMAPSGMGTRFKAIGVRSPDLPKLPGFA